MTFLSGLSEVQAVFDAKRNRESVFELCTPGSRGKPSVIRIFINALHDPLVRFQRKRGENVRYRTLRRAACPADEKKKLIPVITLLVGLAKRPFGRACSP